MHGRAADEPGGTLTRRQEALELGVFLLLILPSLALSFVAVRQGMLPFPLVAASTILRDVALVAPVVMHFLLDLSAIVLLPVLLR
jgi:CAAX protease family protein